MASRSSGLSRISSCGLALVTICVAVLLARPLTAQADTPNPPWRQHCPQRIALVVDLSESMKPNLDAVKQSARNLIDALRGAPNEVTVVTLGTNAVVAVPAGNVGANDERKRIKEKVNDLDVLTGNLGGTNWDAALTTVRVLQPDVVILLTDGQPTAHGQPATAGSGPLDPENLASAVRAADALKSSGTRIVGLGVGLPPENVGNLAAVTGPRVGDDFYQTDTSGLLNKLYDIASKTCGIPVVALPQPEPGTFPLVLVIGAGVVAVIAAVGGGMLLSRLRSGTTVLPSPAARELPDPTISLDDLPPVAPVLIKNEPTAEQTVVPQPGSVRARRVSLDRIHNATPVRKQDHDGSAGTGDGAGKDKKST
jgi:hypothetical protein